jgi:hypothetical protein
MKNIHLIPTTKRSYLAIKDSNNKLELSEKNTFFINGFGFTPQHIYITSDEEIKEGDWVYCNIDNTIDIANDRTNYHRYEFQKIILTTDPDLIKNGIQAIDDEFLEWFVKNPSCEFVPIITTIVLNETTHKTNIGFESWRKDEPKQIKCYCGHTITCDCESLQETLEETAKIWVNNRFTKQICGNESYPDIHASKEGIVESHIIFAKWQKERMYSEDEVKYIISEALQSALVTVDLEQWFAQFKKK